MTSKTSGGPDRGPDHRPKPRRRPARQARHRNLRRVACVGVGLAALLTVGLVTLATQRARQATGHPAAARVATGAAGQATAGQPGGGAVGPVGPAVQVSGPTGATVGRAAPTVAVRTLSGQTFRLPAGRPAVVSFMAAWCESCQFEANALARLQQHTGDRVAILAVDVDPTDQPAATRAFFRAIGQPIGPPGYQVAQDQGGKLAAAFAVRALDTTVVVNPAGRVVWRDAVPTDTATLQAALRTAGLAR